MFNGFSGKDASKITPEMLLPFPDEVNEGKSEGMSAATKLVFKKLILSGQIDPLISSFAIAYCPDLTKEVR